MESGRVTALIGYPRKFERSMVIDEMECSCGIMRELICPEGWYFKEYGIAQAKRLSQNLLPFSDTE